MTSEPVPKRRRNRSTIVCHRCRKKKAKCDKRYPCNQCVRAKCTDECSFDPSHFSPEVVETEADGTFQGVVERSLRFCRERPAESSRPPVLGPVGANKYMVGENLMVSSSDSMNMHMSLSSLQSADNGNTLEPPAFIEPRFVHVFHNFKTSSRNTYAVELSQQDPAIKIYWAHSAISEKVKLMTIQNLDAAKRNEAVKAASRYFGPLFLSSNRLGRTMTMNQLSLYGQSLGFTYTPSYSENDPYQTSLQKLLPSRHVMLAYLERFFAKIYPLYPIVDEAWVFASVDRLFEFSADGMVHAANLSSREDVTTVAMILYMLRLAYLSYLTNIRVHNEEKLNSVHVGGVLLKHVSVSLNCIDLAGAMLQRGHSRSKSSFVLLQAHTLKMIHRLLSLDNETAFCDVDGISGAGSLLQLAVSLMLERDPDHIVNFPGDARQRNLRRKIWYTLLQIENTMSYLFLTPKTVAGNAYRTKLPVFDPSSANVRDLALEKRTIEQLCDTHAIMEAGSPVLDLTLDVTSAISGAVLVQRLNDFECLVRDRFGYIEDHFVKSQAPVHDVFAIARLKVFLTLRIFISYVNYFLHLYYRYKNNQRLSFFFLKKTVLIHMNEFNHLSSALMFCQEEYFDTSFAVMISPILLIIRQTSFILSSAFSISLKCGIIVQNLRNDTSRNTQLMRALCHKIQNFTLQVQKASKLLSERYFYAWKCVKINSFGFKLVSDEVFYMVEPKKLYDAALLYTDEQVAELMDCIREDTPIIASSTEFRQSCYQDVVSGNDADLEGPDLYKTLQTDNFWIVLNTLAEREYASLYLSEQRSEKSSDFGDLRTGSSDSHDKPPLPLGILDPTNTALLEPSTLQILDMNMFSGSWRIEDAFGDVIPAHEKVL